MRRVFVVIGLWFAVAVAATVAFGDPIEVRVSTAESVIAGQPYAVNLLVTKYGRRLHHENAVVTVHYASGNAIAYRATERGHDGIYHALVRVPIQGVYAYDVAINGKISTRGTLAAKVIQPQG